MFKNIFQKIFSGRKKIIVIVLLLVVAFFVIRRVFFTKGVEVQVQTAAVERGTIISSISASGQILTANVININTSASGIVKNVYVKDGDGVGVGQKILEITFDSNGAQKSAAAYASYISAKNSLESAQVTLYTLDSSMWAANRKFINDAVARGLVAEDPTYIQEHDDWLAAEAKYINQKAVISQAQIGLNNAWLIYQAASPIVTAPMAGIINNIVLAQGMTVGSADATGQRVAVIKSEGFPLASFNISEIDVSKVNPGQKATIKLDSIADKTFTGQILTVDRMGSVSSGVTNYPVVIKFDTEASEILPNMAATANIILETKDAVLLVPSTAIKTQGGQSAVTVIKGKQEQTVTVETGLVSETQTEIISGLSEGDEIVVSALTSSSGQPGGRSIFSTGGFGQGGGRTIFGH